MVESSSLGSFKFQNILFQLHNHRNFIASRKQEIKRLKEDGTQLQSFIFDSALIAPTSKPIPQALGSLLLAADASVLEYE